MTQDEIIEMANEAGLAFDSEEYPEIWDVYMNVGREEIVDFAKLVTQKAFADGYEKGVAGFMQAVELEREECAKILDANAMVCESPIMRSLLQSNAQAIRVRGQA